MGGSEAMKKQKNSLIFGLTTIAWCIPAILLCAAPCGAQFVNVGETADIDYAIEDDFLLVLGTANLYPGAYAGWGIDVANGGKVNVYGGEIGNGFFVLLYTGEPSPVVTVYGMDFALDGVPLDPSATQFSVDPYAGGVLTGIYGNGDSIYLWFLSDVPIYLKSPDAGITSEMTIDIKPGSDQNSINLKSKGVVPVAVLTTDDFNAATIDPATIEFAGASPVRWKLEDVDDDGDDDMMFHFNTEELNLDQDSTVATLTAHQLLTEVIVTGTDEVRIVPLKKK